MLLAISVVLTGFAVLYLAVSSEEHHMQKAIRRTKR
jgi:hypothetical protein